MELRKTYNPKEIEDKLYQNWCDAGYFHPEIDKNKKPFTTVMPPPNITGRLHMGHAFDNTLQDILIRYKRMQGFNALWVPGTDHAAIATELKIVEKLKEEGIDKLTLGREEFLKEAWAWKEEYAGHIEEQLKKLGISCDWERERFTMDEGCSKAVLDVFLSLYNKGYIYKGSRIINWCPECKTSLSDAEVEHEEKEGNFWHILYPIKGTDTFVEIATTRPETMLGDTAVAVHPDDERYKDVIGKTVVLPLMNREIPIIADTYVDKDFGTGVVKITPAHDPNDFEVGKRHNLEELNIMNDDATMNENTGKYQFMDRYEARKTIVSDLKELGLLKKIEPHKHNVGTHDRCNTVVEPLVKQQWFVRMEELAIPAINALKTKQLTFVPERFDKIYLHWLENIKDWCISRQIWWGHRIPAYYCKQCGKMVVTLTKPNTCETCGGREWQQDEDTLDTWFSSALWPFSTLGWPEETEDLKHFYPTDVLVTGYDIIFFWVIRMVFSGLEHTGVLPFHTVVIHGLVRDEKGRKMSKSLGNGVDPLEVIEKYGADALRLMLVTGNAPGNDMRFLEEKVISNRNFANKIWNASRFIQMNLAGVTVVEPDWKDLTIADRWVLSKVTTLAKEMTLNMDKYELGIAVSKVYEFIWDEFCDWYIEMTKKRLYQKEEDPKSANAALWTLLTVLAKALQMLHPFMPFVTEEIFLSILPSAPWVTDQESIMMSKWPVYEEDIKDEFAEKMMIRIKEMVRGIRNVRSEMNVENNRKTSVYVHTDLSCLIDGIKELESSILPLMNGTKICFVASKNEVKGESVSIVNQDVLIYIPLDDLIDKKEEIKRLSKEKAKLESEIKRAIGMLSNESFLSKAPATKIQAEQQKLENFKEMKYQVEIQLQALEK